MVIEQLCKCEHTAAMHSNRKDYFKIKKRYNQLFIKHVYLIQTYKQEKESSN